MKPEPKVHPATIIAKVDRLPELPQVALRLSQMLDDPNVSAERLSEIIRVDPGFTSQILRLCNSAAYGFSRTISTVKEAVAILGFKVLKSMVYTIIAKISLDRPVSGYGLREGDLWHNALTCAVYAKHIAQKERFPDPELAFTAALLRDIGKIVLGEFVGANYRDIERIAMTEEIDFVQAEERVLGVNHMIIGLKIAEKWNLPNQLNNVIRHHHKPVNLPPNLDANQLKLIAIVHLADALTMMVGSASGVDGMMYSLDIPMLEKAGLKIQDAYLERLLGELVDLNHVIKSLADSFK